MRVAEKVRNTAPVSQYHNSILLFFQLYLCHAKPVLSYKLNTNEGLITKATASDIKYPLIQRTDLNPKISNLMMVL